MPLFVSAAALVVRVNGPDLLYLSSMKTERRWRTGMTSISTWWKLGIYRNLVSMELWTILTERINCGRALSRCIELPIGLYPKTLSISNEGEPLPEASIRVRFRVTCTLKR